MQYFTCKYISCQGNLQNIEKQKKYYHNILCEWMWNHDEPAFIKYKKLHLRLIRNTRYAVNINEEFYGIFDVEKKNFTTKGDEMYDRIKKYSAAV